MSHRSRFTRDVVLSARTRFVDDSLAPEVTLYSLSQEMDLTIEYVIDILVGKTYPYIDSIVPKDHPKIIAPRPRFTGDDVVAERLAVIAGNGSYKISNVALKLGCRICAAEALLSGHTYVKLPHVVPPELMSRIKHLPRGRMTPELVEDIRIRLVEGQGAITVEDIAAELGRSPSSVSGALRGLTYKHVAAPVVEPLVVSMKRQRNIRTRKLTSEVALFIRLSYKPGVVDVRLLCNKFGVNEHTMTNLLVGKSYKDVPCAVERVRKIADRRKLTDEQVITARDRFKRGLASLSRLSRRHGMSVRSIENMIRGNTYADIPGAVPAHINPYSRDQSITVLARRKAEPIRMRSEFVDDVTERSARKPEVNEQRAA
jgi:hypothetical protein